MSEELPEEAFLIAEPMFFEVASRFADLYISFRQRFVMSCTDGSIYVPRTKDGYVKLTNSMICAHLNQRYAICVYAGSASSKFMCFDVDDGSRDTVVRIQNRLSILGIPRDKIYISSSGGKGFHVEIFFDGLVYTSRLQRLYDYVCECEGLDKRKVEFRPTAGLAIKLPLSVHRKTGNVCWYLDRDTFEPIETINYVMDIQQIPVDDIEKIIARLPHICHTTTKSSITKWAEKVISQDEYDSLVSSSVYPDIKDEGQRHKLMICIAVHNRYRGFSAQANTESLREWYTRQDKHLTKSSQDDVSTDIDQIIDWVYSDKFKIVQQNKDIVFDVCDYKLLAAQSVQSRRKIMFLFLLCMKKYGSMSYSLRTISKITGSSHCAVENSVNRMCADQWFTVQKGRCATNDSTGEIIRLPNRYWANEKIVGWLKGYMGITLPEPVYAALDSCRSVRFSGDAINLGPCQDFKITPESFERAYCGVLIGMTDARGLAQLMTKKEYEKFLRSGLTT